MLEYNQLTNYLNKRVQIECKSNSKLIDGIVYTVDPVSAR